MVETSGAQECGPGLSLFVDGLSCGSVRRQGRGAAHLWAARTRPRTRPRGDHSHPGGPQRGGRTGVRPAAGLPDHRPSGSREETGTHAVPGASEDAARRAWDSPGPAARGMRRGPRQRGRVAFSSSWIAEWYPRLPVAWSSPISHVRFADR
ncbi:hypothetical protein TPA0909_58550 [Streptomyces albus]|nr:hypothetical protein TPA0909_58550 [Streptomyces albus]